jgi:phosphatidylglycerol:prolipoprotein diacylglycerol transferase
MMTGSCFTLLGFVVGGLVWLAMARQRKLATEGMGWVLLAGLCGGVVGAKLTSWWLLYRDALLTQPWSILDPRTGGRALLGGVAGGWLAVEVVKWRLGIRRSTGDLFAVALPAGEAVGRIGCFVNGCCHGCATAVPWAVWQHGAWRHPVQLYSAIVAAVLALGLYMVRNRMAREGDLFWLYLGFYGVGRFMLELVRERNLVTGGLSLVQWVCLGAIGMCLWRFGRRLAPLVLAGGGAQQKRRQDGDTVSL